MDTQNIAKINVTKSLKMIMLDKDVKQYEVGQRIGLKERQAFNRVLQKNTALRVDEVIKIANALNCDVKLSLLDRDTGKEWLCNSDAV